MYGATKIKGSIKRGVRAYGLAAVVALIFLSVTPTQAQPSFTLTFKGQTTFGLVPDQTLRVTALNNFVFADGSVRPVRGHVKVFSGRDNLLFQTDEVEIPPDGFYSFNIDRNVLPLAGEPRTNRLQVRVELIITVPSAAAPGEFIADIKFPATVEVMDNRSGKTTVGGTFTITFCGICSS